MLKRKRTNHSYFETFTDYWKEMFGSFAAGFLKNFTETFMEKLRFESARIIDIVRKSLAGMFMILIGLVFVLIGCAQFINDLIQVSEGLGYAVVGIISLILGRIIIKK